MTDEAMDVDTPAPAPAPANAMSAMMANAKGKGKADGETGTMSEADLKAMNEKEGLPWYVTSYGGCRIYEILGIEMNWIRH